MSAPGATVTEPDGPGSLDLLRRGDVELQGRLPFSSNATLLVSCRLEGVTARAVYKPVRGERPLWDFPPGLHRREVATFLLSEALGWGLVPPTVLRPEAPLGEGSLQLFVDADFEQHYFTLITDERHHDALRRMCLFDVLLNNTDRKSGHCLLGTDDRLWGIDHGLTLSAGFKLRTVIWEFGGEPIPERLLQDVAGLVARGLPGALDGLLDPFERDAVLARARGVLAQPCFPVDRSGRRYPWPLV